METKTNPLNLTPEQLSVLDGLDPDQVANDARDRLIAGPFVEFTSDSTYVRSFRYSVYELALYAKTGRNRMEAMDTLLSVHQVLDPLNVYGIMPADETSTEPLTLVLVAAARQYEIHGREPLVEPEAC